MAGWSHTNKHTSTVFSYNQPVLWLPGLVLSGPESAKDRTSAILQTSCFIFRPSVGPPAANRLWTFNLLKLFQHNIQLFELWQKKLFPDQLSPLPSWRYMTGIDRRIKPRSDKRDSLYEHWWRSLHQLTLDREGTFVWSHARSPILDPDLLSERWQYQPVHVTTSFIPSSMLWKSFIVLALLQSIRVWLWRHCSVLMISMWLAVHLPYLFILFFLLWMVDCKNKLPLRD